MSQWRRSRSVGTVSRRLQGVEIIVISDPCFQGDHLEMEPVLVGGLAE